MNNSSSHREQLTISTTEAAPSRRLKLSRWLSGRRKTDGSWKVFFWLSCFVCLSLCITAVYLGDPRNLSLPVDPDGRVCGEGKLASFPYIYFVTPSEKFMHRAVCVKTCPQLSIQPSSDSRLDCAVNKTVKQCELKLSSKKRDEEVMIYDSTVYLEKVCMPRNAKYFSLIQKALAVNKIDQSLADFTSAAYFLLGFTIFAALMNIFTQMVAADGNRLTKLMRVYFFASTIGFFAISLLCFVRATIMILYQNLEQKEVIAKDQKLASTMQSVNSSWVMLLLVGAVALLICCFIVKAYKKFESQQDDQSSAATIVKIRDELLLFSSRTFSRTSMYSISVIGFILCVLLFVLLMVVEKFIFSIGSQVDGENTLPFEHFKTSLYAYAANAVILAILFWALVLIIQGAEFLAYAVSVYTFDMLVNYIAYTNTQDSSKKILVEEFKTTMQLRLGTIAKSALMTFPTYYLRYFLESVDTSYQRRHQQQQQGADRTKKEHTDTSCLESFQECLVSFYGWTGLKKVQPYGFVHTILHQTDFLEAGELMQQKIDSTSYWYEDMLDGGELFEILAKFTITFVVTGLFFASYFSYCNNLAITIMPTMLMMATACVISNIHVNAYGSVYSASIIYYLLKHENEVPAGSSNEAHLQHFQKFAQALTKSDHHQNDRQGAGKGTTGQRSI